MDTKAQDSGSNPTFGGSQDTPTDVIDNSKAYLARQILQKLPLSNRLSTAVGFFFLSGLRQIAEGLTSVDKVRLLIGNTSTRETIEQLAEVYHHLDPVNQAFESRRHSKRIERSVRLRDTADSLRESIALIDQGTQDERLIRLLIVMCRDKRLQMKVYTRGRLNGRAHIFDYRHTDEEPGSGIVGSSNLEIVRAVRFDGWQDTNAGERAIKIALRKTVFKYKLHQDTELFEKAFGYIREYY
ncbi:hypothetical protein [Roseovarius sp.]|uniref:hypothetical protein n=1 Tax=Roseovarius sp. TaxID=1486281 RepID=UPI0035634AEE